MGINSRNNGEVYRITTIKKKCTGNELQGVLDELCDREIFLSREI